MTTYLKSRIEQTMFVNWEGYKFLENKQHEERCESGKPISETRWEKTHKRFDRNSKDGWRQIGDGHFGGCKGNPVNGWQEHRWTSWSCKDMQKMLDDQGIEYRIGDPHEVIDVYF